MLKRNTTNDLVTPTSTKTKKSSFITFKKVKPGTHEIDEVIIKVELLKNDKKKVTAFIGNCYKLELAYGIKESDAKLAIVQNREGDLFLIKHEDGLKLHPTHTWGKLFLTTYSSYIFVVPTQLSPNHNNEYRYSINPEPTQFTAVGEGIVGKTLTGWKLTFLESLNENETIDNEDEDENGDEDETETEFDDVDMNDMID